MKRIFFILACMLITAVEAFSQPYYTNLDTIPGYYNKYYYSEWYYDCPDYDSTGVPRFATYSVFGDFVNPIVAMFAKQQYTTKPMAVKGLVAMVAIRPSDVHNSHPIYVDMEDTVRGPEYLKLFQWLGTTDSMAELASVRWDTATPHIMRLPLNSQAEASGDTGNIFYCYAYEVHFDKPIYVDSSFYIAGTFYNNVQQFDSVRRIWYYPYLLTHYAYLTEKTGIHGTCPTRYNQTYWKLIYPPYDWENLEHGKMRHDYGLFLPIVDRYVVTVEPDSLSTGMGEVEGNGIFWAGNPDTLRATPYSGYRFFQWSDGNRDNPRIISVESDTLITAEFIDSNRFEITVASGTRNAGRADGSGMYNGGDTATITAIPNTGYRFSHWNDSVTANPRQIIVTHDSAFTAYFYYMYHDTTGINPVASPEALFTLSPNPTTGKVTVTVAGHARGTGELTLRDAAGHEVMRKPLAPAQSSIILDLSKLPSGAYFVTLTTPTATATQRLVLQ